MKTLEQACVPRASVFEQRGQDTVYNIDDLEAEYGFVFGQWLPKNGYEVAKLQIREIYPKGLEVDDPSKIPMELLFPLSLRLSRDEPTA